MKNEKIENFLLDFGLTENEAKVYTTSLSLGPTTVLQISKASGVRRTTVYSLVDVLKKKGLMHIEPRGLKQVFVAEHPEKLESILDAKRTTLKKMLPELSSLYNLKGEESTIRYYEGLESVKTIYDTILEPLGPKDYYLVIGEVQKFFDHDREYFDAFLQQRIKSGVKARLIVTDSEQARYMKKYSLNMNHQVKILPEKTKLSVDVMIVPQKVTIFNLREPLSAISIENKDTIEMQRELFEILWDSLPEEESSSI